MEHSLSNRCSPYGLSTLSNDISFLQSRQEILSYFDLRRQASRGSSRLSDRLPSFAYQNDNRQSGTQFSDRRWHGESSNRSTSRLMNKSKVRKPLNIFKIKSKDSIPAKVVAKESVDQLQSGSDTLVLPLQIVKTKIAKLDHPSVKNLVLPLVCRIELECSTEEDALSSDDCNLDIESLDFNEPISGLERSQNGGLLSGCLKPKFKDSIA